MKSNIWTVARKELARFFGDRRMVVSTLLLPGIMIYVVYTLIGGAVGNMLSVEDDYTTKMSVVNMPQSFESISSGLGYEITQIESGGIDTAKTAITDKSLDLLVVFPPDFDAEVEAYTPANSAPAPAVEIYYNSTRTESSASYDAVNTLLNTHESSMANKFDINPLEDDYNLASEQDEAGFMFASMLPMLIIMMAFSGCMAIGPESIAGEKERGTIATVLITPMKRHDFAIGKILSLALIALLSGMSSTAGVLLSMPNLMGGASGGISASFYTAADYLLILIVVLSTVMLFIALISIISAYAKSVKEAGTYATPLMLVAMVVGVTAMFAQTAQTDLLYYLIPAYNSVQSLLGIFAFEPVAAHIVLTVGVNLLVSVICGFILTRMFNSEKYMFNV